jgi:uncharacterized lipoprotein YajG
MMSGNRTHNGNEVHVASAVRRRIQAVATMTANEEVVTMAAATSRTRLNTAANRNDTRAPRTATAI